MKRVFFASGDEAEKEKPRVAVVAEMAGGRAGISYAGKVLEPFLERDEMARGAERALPDGRALRVQSFPIAPAPDAAAPIPTPQRGAFEPYRVRAWLDGRELSEVVGHASNQDARGALILLLVVGLSDTFLGASVFNNLGITRLLCTGPVFLLGAWCVWTQRWWGVSLALVVAAADTLIFAARTFQSGGAGSFFWTIVARAVLISALWRLQNSMSGLNSAPRGE
jgi:hypothetical protein